MASVTLMAGHRNLVFASLVANETGATFDEQGEWITITDTPDLTIPRYCFEQAFDLAGTRDRGQLESAWRSVLLNKRGYLLRFDESEILISDDKPTDKRPAFLLRFPDDQTKADAESWAERAGFSSLTEYILGAITAFNRGWEERSQQPS